MSEETLSAIEQKPKLPGQKWELLLPLLLTTAVALVGWYVNDYLSSERDRTNKQRDLSVQYLIEAYRRIEIVCARDNPSDVSAEMMRGVESAIADIQLFGSAKQIELAKRVVKEIEDSSNSDPRYLLVELRNNLRSELELEAVSTDSSDIMHFRIIKALPKRGSNKSWK